LTYIQQCEYDAAFGPNRESTASSLRRNPTVKLHGDFDVFGDEFGEDTFNARTHTRKKTRWRRTARIGTLKHHNLGMSNAVQASVQQPRLAPGGASVHCERHKAVKP
jgi:hypothetical protein